MLQSPDNPALSLVLVGDQASVSHNLVAGGGHQAPHGQVVHGGGAGGGGRGEGGGG